MSTNNDKLDWVTLRHGICPRYTCLTMNTLREYQNGELVGCDKCGFRMSSAKFYSLCKPRTFWYYQVKNKSRSEEDRMRDICMLQ